MSAQNQLDQLTGSGKAFWDRTEGKFGMVINSLLIIGGAFLFWKLLPTLIAFVTGLLQLVIVALILGAILFVLFDPKFRTLVGTLYRTAIRSFTGWFVKIDPISIIRDYISKLRQKVKDAELQLTKLRGEMTKMKMAINENKEIVEDSLETAEQVKKKKGTDSAQFIVNARKANRKKLSIEKLSATYKKMDVLYRVISKYKESANYLIEDLTDEVDTKETEYNAIKAGHSALKSAMSVINGNMNERALYEMALESIADDTAMKIGEMDRCLETSQIIIDGIDVQNGIYEEKGMKMLEEWEKNSETFWVTKEEKEKILANPSTMSSNDARSEFADVFKL